MKCLLIFVFLFSVVNQLNAEIDINFCDQNAIPLYDPQIPFNFFANINKYLMTIEGNRGLNNETSEMTEFFDGTRNIAVTRVITSTKRYDVYNYNDLNEAYIILENSCNTVPANDPSIPIVIDSNANILTPILSLLELNGSPVKVVYIGPNIVRGINVNQWQTCVYDSQKETTKRITYSFSNPAYWTPAEDANNITSVPVEVISENKKYDKIWKDTYSIVRFRTELLVDEDFWTTPSGIYCANRNKGKSPPKMPNAFKITGQLISPSNQFDGVSSHRNYIREVFNYNTKLIRRDYVANDIVFSQIEDFNTGIEYKIDRTHGSCAASKLGNDELDSDTDGNYIIMNKNSRLFDFDSIDIQYVGQRKFNNIKSDVWIGITSSGTLTTTYEWYFETNKSSNIEYQKPIAIFIRTNNNDQTDFTINYYFNEFYPNPIDIYEFDLSLCSHNFDSKRFIFTINAGQDKEILLKNQHSLRNLILTSIQEASFVSSLRVIDPELIFIADDIIVAFSIMEKAGFNGHVSNPDEISLDKAIILLKNSISDNTFINKFVINSTFSIKLHVDKDSFRELSRSKEILTTKNDKSYSSGTVAGITILLIIVGIAIGVVIGIFVLEKRLLVTLPKKDQSLVQDEL